MQDFVLVVAHKPEALLSLSQAMRKIGYAVISALPIPSDFNRATRDSPAVVLVHPSANESEQVHCLEQLKTRFHDAGTPIIACGLREEQVSHVEGILGGVPVVVGDPLRINEIQGHLQRILRLITRRELRVTVERMAAHRKLGVGAHASYRYDPMGSLSIHGCFIRTTQLYPVDTQIEISFYLGGSDEYLQLQGTVRRHAIGQGVTNQGVGISFDAVSPEVNQLLESFLEDELGTADLPTRL